MVDMPWLSMERTTASPPLISGIGLSNVGWFEPWCISDAPWRYSAEDTLWLQQSNQPRQSIEPVLNPAFRSSGSDVHGPRKRAGILVRHGCRQAPHIGLYGGVFQDFGHFAQNPRDHGGGCAARRKQADEAARTA